MTAAREILCRLSVLGARVECRDSRLVLCAGRQAVPADLIAAARAAKPELLVMLGRTAAPEHVCSPAPSEGEHLREPMCKKPSISATPAEDPQVSVFDERLRADSSSIHDDEHLQSKHPSEMFSREHLQRKASKMLTEDAQMSAFDRTEDFRGVEPGSASKMLTSSRSSREGARKAAADPAWWLARHHEALNRYRILHPVDEAAGLAWGEVEHRWHMTRGQRMPRDLCAGCRQPIGTGAIAESW